MATGSYDRSFVEYAASSSAYSARTVTELLYPLLAPQSVLDVGCAAGTWLRMWRESGVGEAHGIDGDYVDRELLEIPVPAFTPSDLNKPFDLGRRFDLVQSLEVAEHVEPASSAIFADNIAAHAARFVLFSAAPPGQGGEHHVNERSYDFWRGLFAERGFVALDWLRPRILPDEQVSYWYRYNTFLYVRRELVDGLSGPLKAAVVDDRAPLADVSPLPFRLRKAVVRALPYSAQHQIAKFKSRFLPSGRL